MFMKLSMRSSLLSTAAVAYLMSGCVSVAPTTPGNTPANEGLVSDAPVNIRSTATLPSFSPAVGAFYSCLRLRTEPGSKWIVTEKEPILGGVALVTIKIGVGVDCTNANWLLQTEGPLVGIDSKLEFTAGGGNYLVLLFARSAYKTPFLFEINQADASAQFAAIGPGTSDLVAPPGTASTVTTASGSKYEPGAVFSDCPTCPKMVALPAGTFMMGSDAGEEGRDANEGPRHPVTIKRSFAMSATEVTFDQYDACVKENACPAVITDQGWGRGNRPVMNVSIDDAKKYVAWLSSTTGHSYFIPSESEWEYAARAGTSSPWNTGDALITDDANFFSLFKKTVPVGSYPPNGFGLHDMHGNVAEWVQDCLDTGYLGVPTDGSAATGTCTMHLVRGGHFNSDHQNVRSARRLTTTATTTWRDIGTGIRVTRALAN